MNKSIIKKLYSDLKEGNIVTELNSHKIELANFAEPKEQLKRAEDNYKKAMSYLDSLYNANQDAKKNIPNLLELIDRSSREMQSDINDFVKKVKDLGINPSELKQPKEYEAAIKRVDSLFEYMNKSYKEAVK